MFDKLSDLYNQVGYNAGAVYKKSLQPKCKLQKSTEIVKCSVAYTAVVYAVGLFETRMT